ncbi:MAG: hypothetical protein P4M11_06740, partial [Candidatus Pacebacteria bacterium]|nr:hypothetical protein [Candidatus Paceibacterota bacterium]
MAKKHSFENAGKKMGFGVVNLAMQDGSYFRKALLCHTGTFDGLYGPITVTEQLLTCLADRYNKQRAKPKNDFDFAPILKDHERKVDNVLGRLMADLVVEDWIDPETCGVGKGLYGTLRIDDPAAKLKVEQGLYSQLSITFDEESFETFETSFVAVEAARGSQALSHDNGGNETMSIELQQKLTKLEKKHSGFKKKQSLAAKVRKAVSLEMKDAVGKTDEAITSLASQSKKAELALRTVMLTP